MITPEDKDMCVISEELANQNNLKIGDKISLMITTILKIQRYQKLRLLEFIKWIKRCPHLCREILTVRKM